MIADGRIRHDLRRPQDDLLIGRVKMATDYSIIESDLKNLSTKLKRDLHMREVRKLAQKHYDLSKKAKQKKLIHQLSKQVEELEPTVGRLYSAQHHLKDNQIKGYLIYLLQMKEFFSREVKTKTEIIQKRNQQIKSLVVRLSNMRNEFTKKLRGLPRKSPEFIRLENMSNRMNQIEKRVSVVQSENKKLRENIMDTVSFLRQYKVYEKSYLSKVERMSDSVQRHLENAVAIYEERENFVNKAKIYKDHYTQDVRKAHLNENALSLVLEKTKKFEEFGRLQNDERMDSRIAVTGDLIEKGVTGLEPNLKKEEALYLEVARAAGRRVPKQMKDVFLLNEDKSVSMFTHLEDVLEDINHTQNSISDLKKENIHLLKTMTTSERKLKWEMSEHEAKVSLNKTDAEKTELFMNQEREKLNSLLSSLWKLHNKCNLDKSEFKDGINDSNAIAVKEEIEKGIIEYLMLVEYLQMKKSVEENKSQPSLAKEEEDSPIIEEPPEIEFLDTVQPRTLENEADLNSLKYLQQTKSVLPLERFKQTAIASVEELESAKNSEEESEDK